MAQGDPADSAVPADRAVVSGVEVRVDVDRAGRAVLVDLATPTDRNCRDSHNILGTMTNRPLGETGRPDFRRPY